MKKAFKVLFIGIICLLLVTGLTTLFISYFYSDTLRQELIREFEAQTDKKYSISISNIDLGFFSRSITIDSVRVEPKVNSKLKIISAASVSVNGIRWVSWWTQPLPDFTQVEVIRPIIEIIIPQNYTLTTTQYSDGTIQTEALDSLANFNFTLKNGRGVVLEQGSKRELVSIDDISLQATQVNLQQLLSQSGILFLKGLSVDASGLKWPLHDKFYEVNVGSFNFNKISESVTISDLYFTPTLPKYEFSKERGHQLDRIHLEIPEIQLRGFNLTSLTEQQFSLDTLRMENAWMEVFRNKQIPRRENESVKPLLYEIATGTDVSFELETAQIRNSTIIYEEQKPPSDSAGSISFNELYATLHYFRTATHPKFKETVLTMDVESMFMNVAPLALQVSYPLNNPKNNHTLKAKLESIDPQEVAGMLRNVG
ncbi:MAG: hypothetical protein RI564_11210, partial [Gracilimonas sp.]|nr:hypothetical protein [Gracilimonas sp.]